MNLQANIFGDCYELYKLQNNQLENDHGIDIPLLTSYAIEIRRKRQDKKKLPG